MGNRCYNWYVLTSSFKCGTWLKKSLQRGVINDIIFIVNKSVFRKEGKQMYLIRIPFRKMTFVDKERNFNEVIELSNGTKKEVSERYKGKGVLMSFERGFITIDADRNEIADSVFSRAHNEVAVKEND